MKVWTLQPIEIWDLLQKEKIIYGKEKYVDEYFLSSYKWMMQQMENKLPDYTGNPPIWVWVQPKPDLRSSHGFEKGQRAVRLELEIPEARILISDYDAWHCVLNGWYLNFTDEEEKEFDKERNDIRLFEEMPEQLKTKIVNSWDRIFEIDKLKNTEWTADKQYLQGVIDGLYLSDVKKVKEFVSRGCRL